MEWKRQVQWLGVRAVARNKAHVWQKDNLPHYVPEGWVMALCGQTADPNTLAKVHPDMETPSTLCKLCTSREATS